MAKGGSPGPAKDKEIGAKSAIGRTIFTDDGLSGDLLSLPARVQIVHQMYHAVGEGAQLYDHPIEDIKALFTAVDRDRDGSISHEELANGFRRLDIPLSDAALIEMQEIFDVDGDGNCSWKEFFQIVCEAHTLYPHIKRTFKDRAFLDKNLITNINTVIKTNKELQTEVQKQIREWKGKHKKGPLPRTGRELRAYTSFPAPPKEAFKNFGKPYNYTTGWSHRSRTTAIMIPRGASEEHLLDHDKIGSTHHKSRGKHIRPNSRKVAPVVAGSNHLDLAYDLNDEHEVNNGEVHGTEGGLRKESAYDGMAGAVNEHESVTLANGSTGTAVDHEKHTKTVVHRKLHSDIEWTKHELTEAGRLRLWFYHNRDMVRVALSGYDALGHGLMSPARMIKAFASEFPNVNQDVLKEHLALFPKINVTVPGRQRGSAQTTLKGVIDHAKFAQKSWYLGLQEFNKMHRQTPGKLKELPVPKGLCVDRAEPFQSKYVQKVERAKSPARQEAMARRVARDRQVADSMLGYTRYSRVKSAGVRRAMAEVLTAYSGGLDGSSGKGAKAALKLADAKVPPVAINGGNDEGCVIC